MIIKIILVVAIVLLAFSFIKNHSTAKIRASKKLGILLLFLFAVVTVIFPEATNFLAHQVGVGRGADLLLYALTVSFFTFVINQYLKNKQEEQRLVKLARKLALLEAELIKKK